MNGTDALLASVPRSVVTLAELVSLAVRVDPLLLRRARLELAPDCSAADEADLWFGPLATGRSRAGFALVPALAGGLRARLGADQERLDAAWRVTERAHAHLPPTLRLQETVTWLALSQDPDAAARMEHELASALRTMDERPLRARNLARWAVEALPALPPRARETDAATRLAATANALLAVPDAEAPGRAEGLEGAAVPVRQVGVELLPSGLRISAPAATGASTVRVPALPNESLRIRVSDDVHPRVVLPAAGTSVVGLAAVQRFERLGGYVTGEAYAGASVERIAFADDGRLVVGCADGSIYVWEHDQGLVRQFVVDGLRAFAVGDGRVAAAGARGGVVWDLSARQAIRRLDGAVAALAFQASGLLAGYDDGRAQLFLDGSGAGHAFRFESDVPVLDIATAAGTTHFAVLRAGGRLTYFEHSSSSLDTEVAADTRRIAFSTFGSHVLAFGGQDVVAYSTDERLTAVDRLAMPAVDAASARSGNPTAILARDGDLYVWDVATSFGRRVRRVEVARTARAIAFGPEGTVAVAGAPRSLEIETSTGDTFRVMATHDEPEPLAVERDLVAILHVLGSIALSFHVSALAPKDMERDDVELAFGRGRVLDPEAFDAFRQACEWALQSAADVIESGAGDWRSWLELLLSGKVPRFEPKMELEEAVAAFVEQLRDLLRYGMAQLRDFEVDLGYPVLPSHATRAANRLGTFPLKSIPVPASRVRGSELAEVSFEGDFFAVVDAVGAGADEVRELINRRREIGPPPAEERRRALDALLSGEPPRMLDAIERLSAMAVRDPAEAGLVFAAFADLLRRELPVSGSAAERRPPRPPHIELILRKLVGTELPAEATAGLDLHGTDLRGVSLAGASLADVNLAGAWLEGADFTRADLSGAILAGVQAAHAVFDSAQAEDVDLTDAQLHEARLYGADLDGAILRGAMLDGAVIETARLIGADLTGATLKRSHGHGVDLTAAILEGARLNGADLATAKLDDADCRGAVFDAADLRSGTLRGADLSGADFKDAILDHASLAGVVHVGIRLEGADLDDTELPDDLVPPGGKGFEMPA